MGTTHAITPSGAVFASGSAANYTLSYAAGTLTIVGTASQTISFTAPASATYGDVPIGLTGSASSGLPVSYSVVSGPGSVNNASLTITGAGSIADTQSRVTNLFLHADHLTGVTIHKAARAMDKPSDHVPVIASFDL